MKKIMFVFFSASLSFAVISANAQTQRQDSTKSNTPGQPTTPSETAPSQVPSSESKSKIMQNELPQSVKDAITNDKDKAYAGWEIGTSYRNSSDNTYIVELKKGMEIRTVKFDARGNKVGGDNE